MPLDPNNDYLITQITNLPLLSNRFEGMTLANYDAISDERRGCFSVVFKAFDRVEGKFVALKFYDLSTSSRNDTYRLSGFRREPEILQELINVKRCLQLVCPLSKYPLNLPVTTGRPFEIEAEYFAVEWLDDDLDQYFLSQQSVDASEKLSVFYELILSLEALHRHEVFHRDLKYDNLRLKSVGSERLVIAIDFGTCARFGSSPVGKNYAHPVGARGYAAPEAICGLSGNRLLASYTDIYAAGCLLFELFNPEMFYNAVRQVNPQLDLRLHAMSVGIDRSLPEIDQAISWTQALAKLGSGVGPVSIYDVGSSVPPAVKILLNDLLEVLTNFDYALRKDSLPRARNLIKVALRILQSTRAQKIRLENARAKRLVRESKLAAKIAARKHR